MICQWTDLPEPHQEKGVIVGCSENQAWLLPWWWMHFRMHNAYPVTFFDFGDLSYKAKEWCRKRGEVRELPLLTVRPFKVLEEETSTTIREWGQLYEISRKAWFKKPFACLNSPYEKSLWIDLDCQVRHSLEPIFSFCETPAGIALAREGEIKGLKNTLKKFNTGVIAFKHGSSLIQEWAKICLEKHHVIPGDQDVFELLFAKKGFPFEILPDRYNQLIGYDHKKNKIVLRGEGTIAEAAILHWVGTGKMFLETEMGLLEQHTFMNFSL